MRYWKHHVKKAVIQRDWKQHEESSHTERLDLETSCEESSHTERLDLETCEESSHTETGDIM